MLVSFSIVGYNNPSMLAAVRSSVGLSLMTPRPALGIFPSMEHRELLNDSLLQISPRGMPLVQTMMCGTCSNESAIKSAFILYMVRIYMLHALSARVVIIEQEERLDTS